MAPKKFEIGERKYYGQRWWEWDGKGWRMSEAPSPETTGPDTRGEPPEASTSKTYSGYTGQIDLVDDTIVLRREGIRAKALHLAGAPRTIRLDDLVGIDLKDATRLTNGHVQLRLSDDYAPPKPNEPNTVLFTHGQADGFRELAGFLQERIAARPATQRNAPRSADASSGDRPDRTSLESLVIGRAGKKLLEETQKSCRANERPLFILAEAQAGGLVAFEDRCMIIKKGALTGLMAGSVGGGRVATFMYTDITGVEYNSGWINGVLEILTPSYQGTVNKDFWRGTTKGRNKDSNDPWTLSNTLPLTKPTYEQARSKLDMMRRLIGEAKRPGQASSSPAAPATASLADEIQALAELHRTGVLDDDEFRSAKAKLLSGT
jgi:Domain of unknown function (DUF4429)